MSCLAVDAKIYKKYRQIGEYLKESLLVCRVFTGVKQVRFYHEKAKVQETTVSLCIHVSIGPPCGKQMKILHGVPPPQVDKIWRETTLDRNLLC